MQVKWTYQQLLYCKFLQYTVCQILWKSVSVCRNYSRIKNVDVFWIMLYRVVQKREPVSFLLLTLSNINRLAKFTAWKRKKFPMRVTWYISPHLKCVATLPCEITGTFKYDANLEENENKVGYVNLACTECNLSNLVTYSWLTYWFSGSCWTFFKIAFILYKQA